MVLYRHLFTLLLHTWSILRTRARYLTQRAGNIFNARNYFEIWKQTVKNTFRIDIYHVVSYEKGFHTEFPSKIKKTAIFFKCLQITDLILDIWGMYQK